MFGKSLLTLSNGTPELLSERNFRMCIAPILWPLTLFVFNLYIYQALIYMLTIYIHHMYIYTCVCVYS